jgi:hypothetical protein
MRAGDCVLFNNRTVHGSLANTGTAVRTALSFALQPKGEPLMAYYLKPGTNATIALRYPASPEFYLDYPNPMMAKLYAQDQLVPGEGAEEVPYQMPHVTWDAFQVLLRDSGNTVRSTA